MATYCKRYAASATALLNKYRRDLFFRTEVNVIVLQIAFALIIVGAVGASFALVNRDVSRAIVAGLNANLEGGASATALSAEVVQHIEDIRSRSLAAIILTITLATLFFSYLIAYVTLSPARASLSAQKRFVGNIAHELRTPLSVIKTNTEVALLGPEAPPAVREMLESNVEELDRISEIINNLLTLSALVNPGAPEFGPVDLSALAEESVRAAGPLFRGSRQEVSLRKSDRALVWGNETGLRQIVGNLLKNASQYTPQGGSIAVRIEPAPAGLVELSVEDTGIGIERKDLYRIFEPFYRVDASRTKHAASGASAGSGLGLTIVSELTRMHRGRISVRSEAGRGTTVSILFPAARVAQPAGRPEAAESSLSEIAVDFSRR